MNKKETRKKLMREKLISTIFLDLLMEKIT
jgi:hypothetical protein